MTKQAETRDRVFDLIERLGVGEAIPSELRRIAQGAPLPALGEGRVCEFCAARGLCRRDAWSA